jgi:hypothetical protein
MKSLALASIALCLLPPPRAGRVLGQSPQRRPSVSPYLNLARRGVPPAINYYGLVRPQFEFRSSIQNLQGQVTALEQPGPVDTTEFTSDLPPTGQRAQFMSHTRYFFNAVPTTGGPGRPAAGGSVGPARAARAGRR